MSGAARTDAGPARAGVLGLPKGVTAGLFDLDGVLTNTAAVHDKAWKGDVDDLASLREAAARSSRTSVPMAAGSGASCSLSDNSGPRPTADGGAATSTVDGSQPPTHRPQRAGERARSIHQDRILIRVLHPGRLVQDRTCHLGER